MIQTIVFNHTTMNLKLPFSILGPDWSDKNMELKLPNLLLLFGGIHTTLFFWRTLRNVCGNIWIYLKSFFNAGKYLHP